MGMGTGTGVSGIIHIEHHRPMAIGRRCSIPSKSLLNICKARSGWRWKEKEPEQASELAALSCAAVLAYISQLRGPIGPGPMGRAKPFTPNSVSQIRNLL